MRSPWIDLLFLHGHATPATLMWRPDAEAPICRCKTEQVEADVSRLPLPICLEKSPVCCTGHSLA
ncbi:hypothetical protein ACFFJT_02150 [Dyella flava]|uniref:Uncharacterized protein n=1 Tax=Dyella flava TaxID=1920170 RepID=A0ABS2K4N8_9GAMM|nr:hypothetical protein [Dyella flava]MBM7126198.1 hypothetical protein [Dyella flava]GLQ48996.1 hypothetical protein GCM10010872_04450 [Dyella flava]